MARNDVRMHVRSRFAIWPGDLNSSQLQPHENQRRAGAQVRCNKKRLRSLLFPCRDRSFPGWLTKQKVNARI